MSYQLHTGVIGLGAMGAHMARNLQKNKLLTAVWNRSRDKAETLAAETGCQVTEAPVSGGVEGARQGTLVTMVGGDAEGLEIARPALEAIAGNVIHMGESGAGQATKAVNQLMAAGINQAVTEALAFGESLGLDMDKVVDVVSAGAAGNWFVQHRGKTMLRGVFDPGFKLGLHHKDLEICRSMALEKTGISLPLVEMTLIHYRKLMEEGHGDEDISALYRLKQRLHREGPK